MAQPLYRELASMVQARLNCFKANNPEWLTKWTERIETVMRGAPGGSGIDAGTSIDLGESAGERLVFGCSFHHMDDHGSYDGWTEHRVIVTGALASPGFNLRITGPNRNQIKDYLHDVYSAWLVSPFTVG